MRPLLLAFTLLLCVPAAASARVVIVATDTASAVLIDTRTNTVVGSVAPCWSSSPRLPGGSLRSPKNPEIPSW